MTFCFIYRTMLLSTFLAMDGINMDTPDWSICRERENLENSFLTEFVENEQNILSGGPKYEIIRDLVSQYSHINHDL